MRSFSITDKESEVSSIGTIALAKDIEDFKERFIDACGDHFDSDDIHFKEEFPDVFSNREHKWTIELLIEDEQYTVNIEQTWVY